MALPQKWSIRDIITLTYIKGLSYNTIKKIVENYKSLKDLLKNPEQDSFRNNLMPLEIFSNSLAEAAKMADEQLSLCEKNQVNVVSYWDEKYPSLLKQITGPPVILYVKGKLQSPDSTSISIVGTRKNTLYGKLTAEKYSSFFCNNSIIVTSGLAYGIDSIAHQSAIQAKGITYAVIASGIDQINTSSPTAEKISRNIIESGGVIISEYKCGVKALPAYFPQRNRIISGISLATLIIESGVKGGALITARFAFDQNREVFAIPGNVTSDKSLGTNYLIQKETARITITPEDMLQSLGLNINTNLFDQVSENSKFEGNEKLIMDNLSYEPVQIDMLADKCKLDISEILVKLLELEFRGIVRQLPGKYYIKK